MTSMHAWCRRLTGILALTFAALLVIPLAAAPAQATYGPPQTVSLQLRSYDSYGNQYLVGRVVGTVQFDDGNSQYYLSLTLCRQSSYTAPNLRVFVNGSYQLFFSGTDGTARPQICGDRWGQSLAINGGYIYGGVIRNITITIEGIHFDGSTAKTVSDGATYYNPFN